MRIITDSAADGNERLETYTQRKIAPLKLEIGMETIEDDGTYSQLEILKKLEDARHKFKTAAPSPYDFFKHIDPNGDNFIVTISSKLSATYQNACLAVKIAKEKGKGNFHVIDSKMASSGESLIAIKLRQLMDQGLLFDNIVEEIEAYRSRMSVFASLESLNALSSQGRVGAAASRIASILTVKPIIKAVDGVIEIAATPRGMKKARDKLVDLVLEDLEKNKDRVVNLIGISHANAKEDAELVAKKLQEKLDVEVDIYQTSGLCTTYASEGGIILSY